MCNLVGTGAAPGRAGPIAIRANQTVQIPFKNVLAATVDFVVTASPSHLFTVARAQETIPAKKASSIAVTYKPELAKSEGGKADGAKPDATKQTGGEVRGQLTVVANAPASATGSDAPLRWIFYLRGDV